jgi:hypothetical protein
VRRNGCDGLAGNGKMLTDSEIASQRPHKVALRGHPLSHAGPAENAIS